MALQPAAGVRDLNPGEVARNRRLCELLAQVYRLWGYQEVDPPVIERQDTLAAGGAIAERDVVRLASDDPLGLRPELTASIARAACTRLADQPRPLRLWACGSTFRTSFGDTGSPRISESLQSGVELLGEAAAAADSELLHLLLSATATLGLQARHQPTLLIGHHGLLDALLAEVPGSQRLAVRKALTAFDRLALEALELPAEQRRRLSRLLGLRGDPQKVLASLRQWLGPVALVDDLATMLASVAPTAARHGVRLQVDPTFQPHFDLYDGLVLRLVCQGNDAPVAIASGGRYNGLVARFSPDPNHAAGTGFGFDIGAIRELLGSGEVPDSATTPWLVAAASSDAIGAALARMGELHQQGSAAELCSRPCPSQAAADAVAAERGCRGAIWLAG
ncbi:MAG: ATP phosphoribosyltransferase regulatory subunit [Cyanobacteria bacterium]|nr:ATP phosphoribosyltransferase regulatory subunit [Cyanobacteriota bacterium]